MGMGGAPHPPHGTSLSGPARSAAHQALSPWGSGTGGLRVQFPAPNLLLAPSICSLHVPVLGSPPDGAGDNPHVSHGGCSPVPSVVASLSPLLEMAAGQTPALNPFGKELCLLPQLPRLPRSEVLALPEQLCGADGPLLAPCQNHLLDGCWTSSSSRGQDWGMQETPPRPPVAVGTLVWPVELLCHGWTDLAFQEQICN